MTFRWLSEAVELLDATILPISKSDPQDVVEAENLSEVIAEAKEVSNQQLVAAARRRQQLRLEKEALEAEILERQQAAIAKAQQRQAEIALQALEDIVFKSSTSLQLV